MMTSSFSFLQFLTLRSNTFDIVIDQIMKAFQKVSQKITKEIAEELAIEAHMNGGNCIFSGSQSECMEFKRILTEISCQVDVESPNHIVIHDEDENPSHDRLVVLHYTESKSVTIGTLLGKLSKYVNLAGKSINKNIVHWVSIKIKQSI
jgi:hypothetical protein